MNPETMTLEQIRQKGIEILAQQLGPVGMVRFFQHSETGWGNYTQERHQWLGNPTVKTLAKDILEWRQNKLEKRVQ
jgi:hypothetical protein